MFLFDEFYSSFSSCDENRRERERERERKESDLFPRDLKDWRKKERWRGKVVDSMMDSPLGNMVDERTVHMVKEV